MHYSVGAQFIVVPEKVAPKVSVALESVSWYACAVQYGIVRLPLPSPFIIIFTIPCTIVEKTMISYHAFAATNPAIKATVCEVSSACPDGAILSLSFEYYYLVWKRTNLV